MSIFLSIKKHLMDFSGPLYNDKYYYLLRSSNIYKIVLGIKGDEQMKRIKSLPLFL